MIAEVFTVAVGAVAVAVRAVIWRRTMEAADEADVCAHCGRVLHDSGGRWFGGSWSTDSGESASVRMKGHCSQECCETNRDGWIVVDDAEMRRRWNEMET